MEDRRLWPLYEALTGWFLNLPLWGRVVLGVAVLVAVMALTLARFL